jgi:hypothetical protein
MTFSYLDQERLQDSPHAQCQQVGCDTSASQPRQAERQEVVEGVNVDEAMGTIGTGELFRSEGEKDTMLCIRAGGKAYTVAWRDCILCAIIDMPCWG